MSVPKLDEMVQSDRIHAAIYTNQTIFEQEMKKIYDKVWIYVAHESEIAAPGDFKRSFIGLRPVIVTRTPNGEISVLLNVCTHRGALVCREDKGNSNFFKCMYHGWTFRNSGELLGVPHRHRYGESFDTCDFNLMTAARVETYRGLIFASMNPDVESLSEYLGATKHYIDAFMDLSPEGEIEVRAGCNKYEYAGNWKFQMENGVDGYHAATVHESVSQLQKWRKERHRADGDAVNPNSNDLKKIELKDFKREENQGWTESFTNGHGLLARRAGDGEIDRQRAMFPDYIETLEQKHGAERLNDLLTKLNLFIFPNLYFVRHHIRVIQPFSTEKTEVYLYPYLLTGAPDELNERRLRDHESFHATAGFGSPDDIEVFVAVQQAVASQSLQWLQLSRGIEDEKTFENGTKWGRASDETPQRGMYRQWHRLMTEAKGDT